MVISIKQTIANYTFGTVERTAKVIIQKWLQIAILYLMHKQRHVNMPATDNSLIIDYILHTSFIYSPLGTVSG